MIGIVDLADIERGFTLARRSPKPRVGILKKWSFAEFVNT